jgi:hypothetical protein
MHRVFAFLSDFAKNAKLTMRASAAAHFRPLPARFANRAYYQRLLPNRKEIAKKIAIPSI